MTSSKYRLTKIMEVATGVIFPISGVITQLNFPPEVDVVITNVPEVTVTNFPAAFEVSGVPEVTLTNSTLGEPSVTAEQAITNLPGVTESPVEIPCSNYDGVEVVIEAPHYYVWATNTTVAAARITGDTTRGKRGAGEGTFRLKRTNALNLYVISQGDGVTSGVSYSLEEI